MKGKKSMFFNISLVMITMIVLLTAFIRLSAKYSDDGKGLNRYIGSREYETFRRYSEGERAMFFVDTAAGYAAGAAALELGDFGGTIASPCGSYRGYAKWTTRDRDCYPDARSSFLAYNAASLDAYLSQYTQTPIPADYIYRLSDHITGYAVGNLFISAELPVRGRSTITEAKVYEILNSHNSPAKDYAQHFIEYGEDHGIDPAIALAFFNHESKYGTLGVAAKTKSVGNIRHTSGCAGNYNGFCVYNTWEEGIEAWYGLIDSKAYIDSGLVTVEQIIPKYAPAAENDVQAYIRSVRASAESYRGVGFSGEDATYSVKPSFRIKLDYDLGKYDILKDKAASLLAECRSDPEACVPARLAGLSDADFEWTAECDSAQFSVFHDFVQDFRDCQDSEDTGCTCALTPFIPHYPLDDVFEAEAWPFKGITKVGSGILTGNLSQESPLVIAKTDLASHHCNVSYKTAYTASVPETSLNARCIADRKVEDVAWSGTDIVLYKDPAGLVSFARQGTVSGKPECKLPKNIFTFCVVDKNALFYGYDPFTAGTDKRNVAVKFALEFSDRIPPPPVIGTKAENVPDAENALSVSWDASPAADLREYRVYYSKAAFAGVDDGLPVAVAAKDLTGLELTHLQDYDPDQPINTYFVAVTAVDHSANEDTEVSAVEGRSIDNLAPAPVSGLAATASGKLTLSWARPVQNTDGSALIDLKGFHIFHSASAIADVTGLSAQYVVSSGGANCMDSPDCAYSFSMPATGTHHYAVAAADEVPNIAPSAASVSYTVP
ncbi:MAG: hypothetical protein ABH879_09370 [archaeon]